MQPGWRRESNRGSNLLQGIERLGNGYMLLAFGRSAVPFVFSFVHTSYKQSRTFAREPCNAYVRNLTNQLMRQPIAIAEDTVKEV